MNVALQLRQRLKAEFETQQVPTNPKSAPVPAPSPVGVPPKPAIASEMTVSDNVSAFERPAAVFALHGSELAAARLFCAFLHQYSQEFPIKALLSAVPVGGLTMHVDSMLAAVGNLGFYARHRPFSAERWLISRRPLLVSTPHGPLLLTAAAGSTGGVTYDGTRSGTLEVVAEDLEGCQCWTLEYASADNPLSPTARTHTGYSWARAMLGNFPKVLRTVAILSAMLALAGVMLPLAISVFFGQVIRLSSFSTMPYLIAGLCLIAVAETVFILQRSQVVAWFASRLEFLVNTTSFAQILRLSPALSERAPPTSQAARLRSFESIRDFVSGPTFATILDIPISVLSLIFVAFLSLEALWIMLCAIALFMVVFGVAWRRSMVLTSIAADEATEMQRLAIETFDKLDLIRSCGMQPIWCKRIDTVADKEQRAQMRLRFTGHVSESISSVVYTVSIVSVMAASAAGVWAGDISGPTLLALVILSLRILLPFHTMCLSVQRFEQIRRSLKQINSLMDLPTEDQAEREKNRLAPLTGRLSLVNVGFKVADTRPVFVGLDLEVEPGEVIGIYGANGTGKSTIFKMVLGMVDTTLGAVRIDGVDLRQLPLHELRRRISYVPQRPRIFPGTLRQNLAFANPLASDDQIDRVLTTVGIKQEIEKLANGLEHHVSGPDDERFSAGFRHRFAIARALLVNSKLIMIDEAPNTLLDSEVGALMHRLIDEFRGKRTIMFVSHRTDFLQKADRIVALRYGKVPLVNRPKTIMERAL